LHFFALSVTPSLKIPGAVIPRRVFTQPGPEAAIRPVTELSRALQCTRPQIASRRLTSSMTSSAVAISSVGTVRPIALAVCRLMTNVRPDQRTVLADHVRT
jgi:hypothetical protein